MTEDGGDAKDSEVTDYIMETGKSISSIKRRTKTLIDAGWQPIGGASTYLNDKTMIVFTQSLTKSAAIEIELDYDLISARSPKSLADKVKVKLSENWAPTGSGFVFRSETGDFIFCQTIIR
jgi:hypothetical protein|tara:strand:+ start:523 stop:885 length:363 start_codon:yes stop_codon:yes gene_type:complete